MTDEVREDIFNSMADQYTNAVVNQKTFRKMLKRQKRKDQFVNAVVWLRQNESGETVFALNAEGEEETSREKFVAEFMEKHSDIFDNITMRYCPIQIQLFFFIHYISYYIQKI